jgi:ribose-phosphate pyrophosphokinase
MADNLIIVLDSAGELGTRVAEHLKNVYHVPHEYIIFGNREINTFPNESVREKNVFIVSSGSNINQSINDNLIGTLGMIRACRDASSNYITLVCPYFSYSRSDKKDKSRTPIMCKLVCDFIKTAGANRVISIDLHAAQIQGFFDGPFDNLYATSYLLNEIIANHHDKFVVVTPDAGGIKRIQDWAGRLKCPYTFLTKSRDHSQVSLITKHELVHQLDFSDSCVLLVDDIGDTLGTLVSAAKILKQKGAKNVIAAVTHGIFSGNAFDKLEEEWIDCIYTTNSLPQFANIEKSTKIKVVDISRLFADAILCCINSTSMSALFECA